MLAHASIPVFSGLRFVFTLAIAALAVFAASGATDVGRLTLCLNPVWRFHLGDPPGTPSAPEFNDTNCDIVSLPHSHQLFNANLEGFEEQGRTVGWYRRETQAPPEWLDRNVFL